MRFRSFMSNPDELINESFGFDYTFPKDKVAAIYDFYALSLIDPDTIKTAKYVGGVEINSQDEDLRFSLMQAKKESMNGMRKFMLEAFRRAVSCEIVHFQPFWDKQKEDEYLKENPEWKNVFTKIQNEFNPDRVEYSRASLPKYDIRYQRMSTLKIPDNALYDFAANAFIQKKSSWHSSYGDVRWQIIAKGGKELANTEEIPDTEIWFAFDTGARKLLVAVDHTIDLAHNSGSVFTKWPGLPDELQHAIPLGGGKYTLKPLENKKYMNGLTEYADYVSPQLERALRHLGRHETPEQKKPGAKYPKEPTKYRPPKHVAEKMSDEGFAAYVSDMVKLLGMEDTKKNNAAVKKEMAEVLKSWDADDEIDQAAFLDKKTANWADDMKLVLDKLDKQFGIDAYNDDNKILMLKKTIEEPDISAVSTRKNKPEGHKFPSNERGKRAVLKGKDRFTKSGYLPDLLKDKWKMKKDAPLSAIINKYDATDARGFDDIDFDSLEPWLAGLYKNNHKEFEHVKDRFVPEYEKVTGTELSDEEKKYISDFVDKVEAKAYNKETKKEPALKLDSVNRYLDKLI